MMKKVFLLSSLLLLVAISQCDNFSKKTTNSILGRYELTGRDNSGQLAFTGTISFVSLEQNHLKGQCKIISEQNAPEGLYEKDGNCEALMDGKKIDLDSAPFLDDAGLLLDGEFDGMAIRGIWRLDGGFMLLDPSSTFESIRENIGFLRTILADGSLPMTFCRCFRTTARRSKTNSCAPDVCAETSATRTTTF